MIHGDRDIVSGMSIDRDEHRQIGVEPRQSSAPSQSEHLGVQLIERARLPPHLVDVQEIDGIPEPGDHPAEHVVARMPP